MMFIFSLAVGIQAYDRDGPNGRIAESKFFSIITVLSPDILVPFYIYQNTVK